MSTQGTETMALAAIKPPARTAIEAALRPFVIRSLPIGDAEWRALVKRESSLRRRRYWKRRLLAFRYTNATFSADMEQAYDKLWAGYDFERDLDPASNQSGIEWGQTGYFANPAVTQRIQQFSMAYVIRQADPRAVLEVGSGRGLNMFVLAGLCPDV